MAFDNMNFSGTVLPISRMVGSYKKEHHMCTVPEDDTLGISEVIDITDPGSIPPGNLPFPVRKTAEGILPSFLITPEDMIDLSRLGEVDQPKK